MLLHRSPGDLAFGEVPGDGSASCFAPSGRGLVAPERPPAPAPLRSAHCTQRAPCPAAQLQEAQRASFLTGTLPAQLPDCLLQPDATPGRRNPPLPLLVLPNTEPWAQPNKGRGEGGLFCLVGKSRGWVQPVQSNRGRSSVLLARCPPSPVTAGPMLTKRLLRSRRHLCIPGGKGDTKIHLNRKWQLARYFRKVTPPVIFTRTFFGQNIATPDSKGVNGHLPRIGERGHRLGNAQRLSRPLRVCSVFDYLQNRALTLPRGGQAGGSWDT